MSLKRAKTDQINGQPKTKVRKLDPQHRKNKYCYICGLPNELLQKIVGYIPFWHRPRLRKSCRRLRYICDSVLLHEFQTSIFDLSSKDPDGYNYASLMAIKDATWPYVLHGFDSIFCGTILPLICNNIKFTPEPSKIKQFLKHFYKLVDEKIDKPNSKRSRLLFGITLMGLLKKFKNSRLSISVLTRPNYCRIYFELHGPWVGVLWSSKSACESHVPGILLIILCDLMIAEKTNRAFKQVWECYGDIFVYGNDTSEDFKSPTTEFTIKINAPPKVILLLTSCLENNVVDCPNTLPRTEFVMSIDIACKGALRWGCCPEHHIEIAP